MIPLHQALVANARNIRHALGITLFICGGIILLANLFGGF